MSTSAQRKDVAENPSSHCMLQLAQTSHDTFAARLQYHCIRAKELQMMYSMAVDECMEAEDFLMKAEWQRCSDSCLSQLTSWPVTASAMMWCIEPPNSRPTSHFW